MTELLDEIYKDEMMSEKWNDTYNDLPFEIRQITSKVLIRTQINQLLHEKDRLKRSYQRNLKEINEHLDNLTKAYNEE